MQEMVIGAKAAAHDSPGVSLTPTAPMETEVNGPAEVKVFQQATQSSAAKDGVALVTPVPDVFINPLQKAHSAGIPVAAGMDALVILIGIKAPERAYWTALLAVVGSLGGNLVLYYVARRGGSSLSFILAARRGHVRASGGRARCRVSGKPAAG